MDIAPLKARDASGEMVPLARLKAEHALYSRREVNGRSRRQRASDGKTSPPGGVARYRPRMDRTGVLAAGLKFDVGNALEFAEKDVSIRARPPNF
jgi:hypothetical protein